MIIREERPADIKAIFDLTTDAFMPMHFSNGSEPNIIDQLRKDGDLISSLVVEEGGKILAQVTFSPVKISDTKGKWIGLGPVAVLPDRQKQNIGASLIKDGLSRIAASGVDGCVLIGNPKYYHRFGFRSHEGLSYGDVATEFVQYLKFKDVLPRGEIKFPPAFEVS